MNKITEQHIKLVKEVRSSLGKWHKFTIGVDGVDGSGKSTLARFLAWQTEISIIETDLFLLPREPKFTYRHEDILKIIDFRHNNDRPIIVEGVLLLQLLSKMEIKADYLIYTEKENHNGSYTQQDNFSQYNLEYEPREKSNFRFCWSEVTS